MNEFMQILRHHAEIYPLMRPCDAVKLIFQSVFAGGHMIASEKAAWERLCAEYDRTAHTGQRKIESLGEISRVYLTSPMTDAELSILHRMFCATAADMVADSDARRRFDERIELLTQLCQEGVFGFKPQELADYLAAYRAAGCPAVSHSDAYRTAYLPAYRVIDSKFVRLMDAVSAIDHLLSQNERVVVAIDGRCASGKSTAAQLIAQIFAAEIVHMDDFFLPPELRCEKRLAEVGGNLHRERFIDEVLPHLRDADGFAYRVFECSTFAYADEPRRIGPSRLILCEGSYALHPAFGRYYDLALFSDVAPDEQLRRIKERDGDFMLTRFKNEWIPMEERYFDTFGIRSRCDFILN